VAIPPKGPGKGLAEAEIQTAPENIEHKALFFLKAKVSRSPEVLQNSDTGGFQSAGIVHPHDRGIIADGTGFRRGCDETMETGASAVSHGVQDAVRYGGLGKGHGLLLGKAQKNPQRREYGHAYGKNSRSWAAVF
jgi:hypothetical protein